MLNRSVRISLGRRRAVGLVTKLDSWCLKTCKMQGLQDLLENFNENAQETVKRYNK